jgi:hypothetical protein
MSGSHHIKLGKKVERIAREKQQDTKVDMNFHYSSVRAAYALIRDAIVPLGVGCSTNQEWSHDCEKLFRIWEWHVPLFRRVVEASQSERVRPPGVAEELSANRRTLMCRTGNAL